MSRTPKCVLMLFQLSNFQLLETLETHFLWHWVRCWFLGARWNSAKPRSSLFQLKQTDVSCPGWVRSSGLGLGHQGVSARLPVSRWITTFTVVIVQLWPLTSGARPPLADYRLVFGILCQQHDQWLCLGPHNGIDFFFKLQLSLCYRNYLEWFVGSYTINA